MRESSRGIISRYCDDIRTGSKKDIKEIGSLLFGVGHFLLQGAHHSVDFRKIVVYGTADLRHGAEAVRPRSSYELLLVCLRKKKNRAGQNKKDNGQIREREKRAHTDTAILHTDSSERRILTGLVPWYFLKQ